MTEFPARAGIPYMNAPDPAVVDSTYNPELAAEVLRRMQVRELTPSALAKLFPVNPFTGKSLHSSMILKWTGLHTHRWQGPSRRNWEILESLLGPGLPRTLSEKDADDESNGTGGQQGSQRNLRRMFTAVPLHVAVGDPVRLRGGRRVGVLEVIEGARGSVRWGEPDPYVVSIGLVELERAA